MKKIDKFMYCVEQADGMTGEEFELWWKVITKSSLWRVLNENVIDDDTFTCIQPTSKGKASNL
jgi:hypothetical protein